MSPVSPARLSSPPATTSQSANTFDGALNVSQIQHAMTYAPTGIDQYDQMFTEIGKQPARDIINGRDLAKDFPQGDIANSTLTWPPELDSNTPTATMVGVGWYSVIPLTALAASGFRITAYEINPAKIVRGQIGLTGKEDSFSFYPAMNEPEIMPNFSDTQLEKLPPVISEIRNLPKYKKAMEKVFAIAQLKSAGREARSKYDDLPIDQKISKREVIEQKEEALETLQKSGYLKIIPQEATIDLISEKLDNNQPVFLATGQQVNLARMGMDDLDGRPGFVKEFLLGSAQTENAIAKLAQLQKQTLDKANSTGLAHDKIPEEQLPHVAIVGGGPIAIGSLLDIINRVDPQHLKVSWVHPEEKLNEFAQNTSLREEARSSMDFKEIMGKISHIEFSEDNNVKSVMVDDFKNGDSQQEIVPDLLIHTRDESLIGDNKNVEPFTKALDAVTTALDKEKPDNSISRFRNIINAVESRDLTKRLTKSLTLTLEDDEKLKQKFTQLIERQNKGEQPTIVIYGNNIMTESATILAHDLGYRGKLVQITAPKFKEQRDEQSQFEDIKSKVKVWDVVKGRSVKEGTDFKNNQFSLGLKKETGENYTIEKIDVLINGAGKTHRTPLIESMIDKGYIGIDTEEKLFSGLYSKNNALDGFHNLFQSSPPAPEEGKFPTITLSPDYGSNHSTPSGWEKAFEFGRHMREQATQSKKIDM